jgi:hypothetical protein
VPDYRNLYRVSVTYPAPTISNGRPVNWTASSTTREEWGRLKVTVAGVDYSEYRDVPTIVESWSSAEPFGDATARIRFPAATVYDSIAGPLTPWGEVEILRLHPDGVTETPLWVGLIAAFEESVGEDDRGVVAVCMGAVHQVGLYRRLPKPDDSAVDIRTLISDQFKTDAAWRPHLRTNDMATTPATGITSRYRGSGETTDQYIQKLLELAVEADGDMWTVAQDYPTNPWTPTLELKDRTTVDWTVVAGQPGLTLDLQRELSSGLNVIYGEGEYGGSRYRNFYELTGGMVFQPFAYKDEVHPWDPDGTGGLTTDYVRINDALVRVEGFQQFGSGVTYTEAIASAEQQRLRAQDVGWVGNGKLHADPQEGHRAEMRAGDNIEVQSHHQSDRVFHIAAVDVQVGENEPVVTLTVDTQARDYPTLAAIIERDREVSRKPLARLTGRTFEGQPTSRATWDDNIGSGWVPAARKFDGTSTVAVATGWNIIKFRASERDTVWKIEAHTAAARAYGIAIFNGEVTSGELPADPFADGAWDPANYTAEDRYLIHWGQYNAERAAEERAGYYPGYETDGDAVTGNFVDDAPWVYHHDNGIDADAQQYLWMAVYLDGAATTFWSKLTRGPGLP